MNYDFRDEEFSIASEIEYLLKAENKMICKFIVFTGELFTVMGMTQNLGFDPISGENPNFWEKSQFLEKKSKLLGKIPIFGKNPNFGDFQPLRQGIWERGCPAEKSYGSCLSYWDCEIGPAWESFTIDTTGGACINVWQEGKNGQFYEAKVALHFDQ